MNRRLGGLKAKKTGDLFERLIEHRCRALQIGLVSLPPVGTRIIKGKGKLLHQLEKMPFDRILMHQGKVAFIDAKTRQKTFTYSDIHSTKSRHQLEAMLECDHHGHLAGYIVWFRDEDIIEFFHCVAAFHVKPRESLSPGKGLALGNLSNFDIERIFRMLK